MKISTVGVVVGMLWIAGAAGCASTSGPASPRIHSPAESSADALLPGPQLRGLAFDARGADFTAWVDAFEKAVHHNWVLPTYFGYGGQVEFALVVERNGTISAIEVLESTASEPLQKAAREALARSRVAPLPAGFDRLRVTMQVTCVYGPPPGE